jgi:predicted deacetylase
MFRKKELSEFMESTTVKCVHRWSSTVITNFHCSVTQLPFSSFVQMHRSPQSREDDKPSEYQRAAEFGRQEKEECERRYRCAFSLIGAANFLFSYFLPPSTAWRDNRDSDWTLPCSSPVATAVDPVNWLFNIYSTIRHCYLYAKVPWIAPVLKWQRFAKTLFLNPIPYIAHHL